MLTFRFGLVSLGLCLLGLLVLVRVVAPGALPEPVSYIAYLSAFFVFVSLLHPETLIRQLVAVAMPFAWLVHRVYVFIDSYLMFKCEAYGSFGCRDAFKPSSERRGGEK